MGTQEPSQRTARAHHIYTQATPLKTKYLDINKQVCGGGRGDSGELQLLWAAAANEDKQALPLVDHFVSIAKNVLLSFLIDFCV